MYKVRIYKNNSYATTKVNTLKEAKSLRRYFVSNGIKSEIILPKKTKSKSKRKQKNPFGGLFKV